MLEDTDHDAQTPNASEQPHWYWRLWTCCLGYGCLDYQVDEYPAYLIPYEPVGQFQRAASMGDLSTVEHFITSRRYHVDKCDRRNRTSLHYACAHNHPEVVTLLIESNCNINVQDDEGCTPLIKATERNNLECVFILLKHGADPHMADFTGNTALHYAVYNGNKAIASELLEYKVDINTTTKHGFTPFSLAVFEKKEIMAEFLRERGASVHEVIVSNSEASHGEEPTSVLNYDAQINTEVDDSTEHTSLPSGGTSFKHPEERTKKQIKFNKEVQYSNDPKPFCSEETHPGQLKPILKKPDQIGTEVDNIMEEKSLSGLPDKPDPDIPGPTLEDNDSISIIKKMTEKKKKHERKDAYMHSRHSSVKRNEDIKKQVDWHQVRLKELLKNDIKEILKEQLATEHARMRKTLRNDVKKISELIRTELRQICIEQVALFQAQVKETQQEQVNLQYLQLKDLLRRDLKQVLHEQMKKSQIIICPKEEPLPGTSKGTADLQRTSLQQKVKKKYEGDHDSSPSHSEEPLMQTDEGRQSESHCMPLKEFIKEELKEAFCEIFERTKYDTCLKKELPHISKERKQIRKTPKEQTIKNKYDSKSLQPGKQAAAKTAKEAEHVHSESQYVHLKEDIKKDFKVKICEVLEQQESNICPKEEGLHHIFKGKTRIMKVSQEQDMGKEYTVKYAPFRSQPSMRLDETPVGEQNAQQHKHLKEHFQKDLKVEEKKTGYLYVPNFSSFEHRIAALRATAHIEPAPAACTGGAGDMGAMDKALKTELALPLALALQTEHPRGQQHFNPEPAPEHCSDETIDPDHNADFALDSCFLAHGKGDRLSTDPESAPLCGPCDIKGPANDAELDVHAAYSTDHSSQGINTNTRSAPVRGRGDSTGHDNGTDLGSTLPVVVDCGDG